MSTTETNPVRANCEPSSAQPAEARAAAAERPPKKRDCRIYERHILNRETQQAVAADYGMTQQRVSQIAARVEAWIARHPEHRLAQRMRLRCSRRWETIWSEAMASFARSREDRKTRKERLRGGTLDEGGRCRRKA